jgi:hypothetical protein
MIKKNKIKNIAFPNKEKTQKSLLSTASGIIQKKKKKKFQTWVSSTIFIIISYQKK